MPVRRCFPFQFRCKPNTIRPIDDRLRRVPRILAAQNQRLGRPLDEHDLADLSQDAALIILSKQHLFDGDGPRAGWVYRVCGMEIRNRVRRKWRELRATDPGSIDTVRDATAPDQDVVALHETVRNALAQLPADDAEVVRAKCIDGLTFEEMARRLAAPEGTLKARYYRAISRLRRWLRAADGRAEGYR